MKAFNDKTLCCLAIVLRILLSNIIILIAIFSFLPRKIYSDKISGKNIRILKSDTVLILKIIGTKMGYIDYPYTVFKKNDSITVNNDSLIIFYQRKESISKKKDSDTLLYIIPSDLFLNNCN